MHLHPELRAWRLSVIDPGRNGLVPRARVASDGDESGRGLRVVHGITEGMWGTFQSSVGERVVWALVPRLSGQSPGTAVMNDDDPGYVEARHDEFGPFVRLRWGQVRLVTRERAWLEFLHVVKDGGYMPAPVSNKPGWVRAEIDDGHSKHDRPVGWQPKVLEVPEQTWSRFVEAVRADLFSDLTAEMWKGNPAAKAREWRITPTVGGWGVWERVSAKGAGKDAASPPPHEEPPLPEGKSSEGRCG